MADTYIFNPYTSSDQDPSPEKKPNHTLSPSGQTSSPSGDTTDSTPPKQRDDSSASKDSDTTHTSQHIDTSQPEADQPAHNQPVNASASTTIHKGI